MDNPIKKLRNELGLSRAQFAILTGVCFHTVQLHETGNTASLQPKLSAGLEVIGVDTETLAEDYLQWRAEQSVQLQQVCRGFVDNGESCL